MQLFSKLGHSCIEEFLFPQPNPMADITYHSTHLPAVFLEAARILRREESLLTTPLTNVSIVFNAAGDRCTVNATVPSVVTLDATTGNAVYATSNYTNYGDDLTLTGTPLASKGVNHVAEALVVAGLELDLAERAAIAANKTIPTGVAVDISQTPSTTTISATLPISIDLNASGQQVVVAQNYLA